MYTPLSSADFKSILSVPGYVGITCTSSGAPTAKVDFSMVPAGAGNLIKMPVYGLKEYDTIKCEIPYDKDKGDEKLAELESRLGLFGFVLTITTPQKGSTNRIYMCGLSEVMAPDKSSKADQAIIGVTLNPYAVKGSNARLKAEITDDSTAIAQSPNDQALTTSTAANQIVPGLDINGILTSARTIGNIFGVNI
jgi:hypothetical protein